MAPRGTQVKPQISMEDKFIEDPDLEALLEEWMEAKGEKAEAVTAFNELDEKAKGKVMALDLAVGEEVRCGRFILSKTEQDEKEVSFTRGAKVKARIKPLEASE